MTDGAVILHMEPAAQTINSSMMVTAPFLMKTCMVRQISHDNDIQILGQGIISYLTAATQIIPMVVTMGESENRITSKVCLFGRDQGPTAAAEAREYVADAENRF